MRHQPVTIRYSHLRGGWHNGTERISRQIDGLDFIPLLEERFDFVIKKEMMETEAVQKLLKVLKDPAFRKEIAHFSGNDYRDLGKIITEV